MYTVYILISPAHSKTYVGSTDNLDRRLSEHNLGKSIFTSRYKPWKVIYNERYNTLVEARKRERYLKSRSGRRWMKANLFNNL